jgi:hypothetical protein
MAHEGISTTVRITVEERRFSAASTHKEKEKKRASAPLLLPVP